MAQLVVVGSVNMDLTMPLAQLPQSGQTLLGGDTRWGPGGKGANQAVAAARLGVDVAFVGAVGSDHFATTLRQALTDEGVDVSQLIDLKEKASGLALILSTEGGESTILVSAGANAQLSTDQVDTLAGLGFLGASILACQLEIPHPIAELAMVKARQAGLKVFLDPSPAEGVGAKLVGRADLVTPNRVEATALTGIAVTDFASAKAAGKKLLALGAGAAVVKLGHRGSVLVSARLVETIPAHQVTTVDATAAGDAFSGGLVAATLQGADLVEACRYATAVAAVAVTRPGAMASLPHRNEVTAKPVHRGA
ncbi:MAG: ribokinase [Sulfobacillus sp.]